MREQLKQMLFERALSIAKSQGFDFTALTQQEIREFINKGVDKMSVWEINSDTDKARAISNTEILVERMIRDAKSRFINESLDYKSFSSVRDVICPLWPFC
ncbi:hypothetical protein [uncultured Chryseobacterium sp.]|uniref:hypothetical protein n=1 Tax=uncultured Chryseobacterium sp. TaxID=259322 RepID=UPI0025E5F5F3|nr:hypothetical protein [uncultured Chryseobacterium sp.]